MTRRLSGVLAVALACLLVAAPFAAAQGDEETPAPTSSLQIQRVDARDPDAVQMVVHYTGAVSALESATIVDNGDQLSPVDVTPLAGSDSFMVIVIDTSEAMFQGEVINQIRPALRDLVQNRPTGQRVGIVTYGGAMRIAQRPTSDTDRLLATIEGLGAGGIARAWSGLHAGALMAREVSADQAFIVMVAAGQNQGGVGISRARGAVASTGASLWATGLEDRGIQVNSLRSVVSTAGGHYSPNVNVSALPQIITELGERINQHYVVTYRSGSTGPIDLTLRVGDMSTSVSFGIGGVSSGASSLAPLEVIEPPGVGFLRDNGYAIGMILALLGAFLAAFAIGSLILPDRSGLDSALEVYTEGPGGSTAVDDDDGSAFARTAFIQKAVGLTEDFAKSRGVLATVEARLERADLPLRAAEAMLFYACSVLLLLVLVFVLTGANILGAIIGTVLVAALPPAVINFLAARRQKQFVSQLPDTLELLSGTLRAGYSLMQGVEAVSREVSEPMGKELRRIITEARLGRPLEEALDASAERMESPDFAWAVMAIRIQREVGGNLAELLATVADTMIQRERLRRDVSALTAEGRVSAIVLGLLPVGLGVVLYMGNPDYIGILFEERIGQFMLIGAAILAGIGFYWMKKVIEVDV